MDTRTQPGRDRRDPSLTLIMGERAQLINVAYRLLGSLTEAEDAVQETYARWYAMSRQQRDAIATPGAWLTTVASRICLDLLGSARVRRERYAGTWLPEPLPDPVERRSGGPGSAPDPADLVTMDESLSMALLVVLDRMTPAQRVAFVLHDVFEYPFAEVAEITGRTTAACRQLASTARRRVNAAQSAPTPTARQADLVRDFKQAWDAGDISAMISLLDPGATTVADDGGLLGAHPGPVQGRERVARLYVEIGRRLPRLTILEYRVNGRPGLVAQRGGVTIAVYAFDFQEDRIKQIWGMANPMKLRPWATAS